MKSGMRAMDYSNDGQTMCALSSRTAFANGACSKVAKGFSGRVPAKQTFRSIGAGCSQVHLSPRGQKPFLSTSQHELAETAAHTTVIEASLSAFAIRNM